MKRFFGCALLAALVVLVPRLASADSSSARVTPCAANATHMVSKRSHALIAPCVAPKNRFVLETNYYQNASKAGGSALAAYPEVRMRYGAANHLELFLDGPSEIAKSGLKGRGIYVMAPVGYGATYEFARVRGVSYSLTAENRPPLQPLANIYLMPLSDVHMSATWSGSGRRTYGAEFGVLEYESVRRHSNHRGSSIAAFSVTQEVNRRTFVTAELSDQFRALGGNAPQASATLSMQRLLTQHFVFNLEGGTTFNAKGDSKPHYWGFGLIYH